MAHSDRDTEAERTAAVNDAVTAALERPTNAAALAMVDAAHDYLDSISRAGFVHPQVGKAVQTIQNGQMGPADDEADAEKILEGAEELAGAMMTPFQTDDTGETNDLERLVADAIGHEKRAAARPARTRDEPF